MISKCKCGHDKDNHTAMRCAQVCSCRCFSPAEPDDNFKIEPISQHTLKVPVQYKGQAEPLDFTEPDATERARRMHSQSLANDKITKSTAELMVAFLESETPRIKAEAVREFCDAVDNKAQELMIQDGKVEGKHYAAMRLIAPKYLGDKWK